MTEGNSKLPFEKWTEEEHLTTVLFLDMLFHHYIHQNDLLHSRTHVVLGLQAAGLGAGWVADKTWGTCALLLVAFITLLLAQVISRDRQCRNVNLKLMRQAEEFLLPDQPPCDTGTAKDCFPKKICVGTPASKFNWKGEYILFALMALLFVVDLVAAWAKYNGGFHSQLTVP